MKDSDNTIHAHIDEELSRGEMMAQLGLGDIFLDISALRPEVQNIFNNVALDFDCHRDKVVISAIAAVCAVVGKKAFVKYRHFINRCSVYAMIVDYKGGIKSSVTKYMMAPIVKIDKKNRDEPNDQLLRTKSDEIISPLSTILTRGATSEEKHKLLAASKAGILMWKDEISVYFKERGKYSSKKDSGESQEDCTLFDGMSQSPDRISDKLKMSNPDVAYSIFGTTTTPTFAENFTNFFLSETGEYDRYLYVLTDWRKRRHEDYDEKLHTDNVEWETLINDLNSMPSNQEYYLEEEARILYLDYKNSECIDAINEDPNYTYFLTGYKQRNAHFLLRLSLIFHLLNNRRNPIITKAEMEMTIRCMKVFNIYAEKCYNLILTSQEKRDKDISASEIIRDIYKYNQKKGKPTKFINQSEIARNLDISQAAVAKELRKLKDGSVIVESTK